MALGGVTAASADVTISGYTRFQYDTLSDDTDEKNGQNSSGMSTDYNVWIKSDMVSDSGLSYGAGVRLEPGKDGNASGARHYIYAQDDWGKVMFGKYHGPAYTMSLGADWRGTVSAHADQSTYNVFKGHANPRVIYMSPDISGFKFGVSYNDAGTGSSDNEMQYGANYTMPMSDGHIKFGVSHTTVDEKGEASTLTDTLLDADNNSITYDVDSEQEATEFGVEFVTGDLLVSLVSFERENSGVTFAADRHSDGNKGSLDEYSGHEVEFAFNATDTLTLSAVYFDAEGEGGYVDISNPDAIPAVVDTALGIKDNKYNHMIVGAKYTIAPGFWASLSHTQFEHESNFDDSSPTSENDGSATRLRLNVSF